MLVRLSCLMGIAYYIIDLKGMPTSWMWYVLAIGIGMTLVDMYAEKI